MPINLYRNVIAVDLIDGSMRPSCLVRIYDVDGKKIAKLKMFGYGKPEFKDNGDINVSECWKFSYQFLNDIEMTEEMFDCTKEGFFDEENFWNEESAAYDLLAINNLIN